MLEVHPVLVPEDFVLQAQPHVVHLGFHLRKGLLFCINIDIVNVEKWSTELDAARVAPLHHTRCIMIFWHFNDQDFLLVHANDPDLLENVAVPNFEVKSYSPLLLRV